MNKNLHLYVVPYDVIFPLGGILSFSAGCCSSFHKFSFLSPLHYSSRSPPSLHLSLSPSLLCGGRAGLFICLHKPNLFLQPDVSWQASVSGAAGPPPTTTILRSAKQSRLSVWLSPPSTLHKMDVSLKARLIVDIGVMASFIMVNII